MERCFLSPFCLPWSFTERIVFTVCLRGLLPILPIILYKCILFQGGRVQGQGGWAGGAVPDNPQDGTLGPGRQGLAGWVRRGVQLQGYTRLGGFTPS